MKWKYKVIALSNDAQANAKELNRLGLVRWELITVQGDKNAGFAYLKIEAAEPRRPTTLYASARSVGANNRLGWYRNLSHSPTTSRAGLYAFATAKLAWHRAAQLSV
jgi:hypothetical protein